MGGFEWELVGEKAPHGGGRLNLSNPETGALLPAGTVCPCFCEVKGKWPGGTCRVDDVSISLTPVQQNNQLLFSLTESTAHFISKLEHVVMETDALGCTINRPLARFVCFPFFFCFHVNYQNVMY